jgi:hypothetical protein
LPRRGLFPLDRLEQRVEVALPMPIELADELRTIRRTTSRPFRAIKATDTRRPEKQSERNSPREPTKPDNDQRPKERKPQTSRRPNFFPGNSLGGFAACW